MRKEPLGKPPGAGVALRDQLCGARDRYDAG
jgi:hypothetical protein